MLSSSLRCWTSARCLLFTFTLFSSFTHAWNFRAVESGECGPLTVTWSGGNAPFTLTLHPLGGSGQSVNIPPSAVSSAQGSFQIALPVPAKRRFLVTMGDANGPLSGGTSPLMTASARSANPNTTNTTTCNSTYSAPDFVWSANPVDIHQCQTYPFTDIGTDNPTTLYVLIPNGDESFTVQMPQAPSFAWPVSVKAQTRVVFDMVDNQGNQGGVGNLLVVRDGDTSCTLHNTNDTSETGPANNNTSGRLSTLSIIGIVAGCVGPLALVAIAVILLLRKNREKRLGHNNCPGEKPIDNNGSFQYHPSSLDGAVPYTDGHTLTVLTPSGMTTRPTNHYRRHHPTTSPEHEQQPKPSYYTTKQREPQPRYIQHSDIADGSNSEYYACDEPQQQPKCGSSVQVELPPQYYTHGSTTMVNSSSTTAPQMGWETRRPPPLPC